MGKYLPRPLRSNWPFALAADRAREEAWDGAAPLPARILAAQKEAQAAARQRVQAMADAAAATEIGGLEQQVEAARLRPKREMARTLRSFGQDDLNAIWRKQIEREGNKIDGRYHRALSALGAFPQWKADELQDAAEFCAALKPKDISARIAGSEIDAAINDPRWAAKGSLSCH